MGGVGVGRVENIRAGDGPSRGREIPSTGRGGIGWYRGDAGNRRVGVQSDIGAECVLSEVVEMRDELERPKIMPWGVDTGILGTIGLWNSEAMYLGQYFFDADLLHLLLGKELAVCDIDPSCLRSGVVGFVRQNFSLREEQSCVPAFDEVNCGLSPGFLDELNDG